MPWLALFLFLFSIPAGAASLLVSGAGRDAIPLQRQDDEPLNAGELLAVFSPLDTEHPVAFLKVTDVQPKSARADIYLLTGKEQILPGDHAESFSWQGTDRRLVGNTSLLLSNQRKISRKYKHLLFLGDTINPTAHTLAKDEHSFNFVNGFYHFGLTDYWMVGTSIFGNIIGAYNLETRLRLNDSKDFTISLGVGATQTKDTEVGVLSAYLAVPSNGRFIAHSSVDIRLARERASRFDSVQGLRGSLNTESNFKTATEYILGNWDRIVFGPQFYFNPKSIGGFWAYHFVWDRFELALGIRTRNFIAISKTAGFFNLSWRF